MRRWTTKNLKGLRYFRNPFFLVPSFWNLTSKPAFCIPIKDEPVFLKRNFLSLVPQQEASAAAKVNDQSARRLRMISTSVSN